MININRVVEVSLRFPGCESVEARYLEKGDEILVRGEWHTVENNYLHPRSPYAELNLIPDSERDYYRINRISGMYFKLDLSIRVTRRTKETKMSIYLMNSSNYARDITQKLGDLAALQDAPPRVEVIPSVFVDKDVLLNTLRADIKVLYSKLGEQIKKI